MGRHRQQVRTFALIWTGLTLLIGACTFVAVYAATGMAANSRNAPVSIQPPVDQAQSAGQPNDAAVGLLVQVTATPLQAQPAQTQPPAAATQPPAAPGAGPTPTLAPIKDTDFDLGIAVQKSLDHKPATYQLWVDMAAKQLKLNWVKSQVVWSDIEAVKGKFDWTDFDVSMPILAKENVKVLLSITKAPSWARDPGAITNQPGKFDGPPRNPQDFVDFVTAILKRYPGQVHAIEVWNEINLDREWTTNPKRLDPARYVQLLKAAYEAIKAIDPNIIVITAALSPTGANIAGAVMDDFTYMDALIKAGMLQFADCVGAHHNGLNVPPNADWNNIPERSPRAKYHGPWDNPHHSWAFKSTLTGYADRIKKAGSNLKLCVTEFGWPSIQDINKGQLSADLKARGFDFAADNSLADQANFVDQAITLMQQWGFVRLAFVWNLNYGAQAGWSLNGPVADNVVWSILGPNFQPRPVWNKIADRNFRGQVRKATP